MRRHVDVDENLPPVAISRRVLNEMCAHALETHPEECCGLVVGDDREWFRRPIRCRNEMTQLHQRDRARYPRDGRAAFYMSETDQLRVQEEAEAAGERVTAVYHSHVGADAYLSEMDLEYAESAQFPFPDADHIVIAVFEGRVGKLGVFRRDGRAARFFGLPLESTDP